MSSACINPILYGYLNETFRKEFIEIAGPLKSCVESKLPTCLTSKCCCSLSKAVKAEEQNSNIQATPIELQPLEIKVQNGGNGKSPKVENKLIPREATRPRSNISIEKKSMELITVHKS